MLSSPEVTVSVRRRFDLSASLECELVEHIDPAADPDKEVVQVSPNEHPDGPCFPVLTLFPFLERIPERDGVLKAKTMQGPYVLRGHVRTLP